MGLGCRSRGKWMLKAAIGAGLAVEGAWQEPELPQPGSQAGTATARGCSGWQLRIHGPREIDGSFGPNVRHCGGLRQGTNEAPNRVARSSCTPMLAAKQQYRRCDARISKSPIPLNPTLWARVSPCHADPAMFGSTTSGRVPSSQPARGEQSPNKTNRIKN